MEYWIFGIFLAVAAGQDLRKKRVDLWVYVIFGSLAFVLAVSRQLQGTADFQWKKFIGGSFLGLMLLGIGRFSGGSVGSGDGLFFFVSGMMLKFSENLLLLCYGILLCGLYSLCYLVWKRFQTEEYQNLKLHKVPFLPFLLPAGIWLITAGI